MANDMAADGGLNEAIIVGELVTEPESRELPSGSIAVSFSLTVRVPDEKTTSVPLVWYDPPKRVLRWKVGDVIIARGSVFRRFFRGGSGLGSSTEVVVADADKNSASRSRLRMLAATAKKLDRCSI